MRENSKTMPSPSLRIVAWAFAVWLPWPCGAADGGGSQTDWADPAWPVRWRIEVPTPLPAPGSGKADGLEDPASVHVRLPSEEIEAAGGLDSLRVTPRGTRKVLPLRARRIERSGQTEIVFPAAGRVQAIRSRPRTACGG